MPVLSLAFVQMEMIFGFIGWQSLPEVCTLEQGVTIRLFRGTVPRNARCFMTTFLGEEMTVRFEIWRALLVGCHNMKSRSLMADFIDAILASDIIIRSVRRFSLGLAWPLNRNPFES